MGQTAMEIGLHRTTCPAALRHGFQNDVMLPEHKPFGKVGRPPWASQSPLSVGAFVTRCKIAKGNKMIASNTRWIKRNAPSLEPFGILALLSVLIAVPAFLMIGVLEPGLVLPAFSMLLFTEAAIAAIVARRNAENVENVTLWDIAGAFTMMGCAAAIFSEPDQVAQFFEQPVEQHPDKPL
jgi:hypothetical protein